MRKHMHARRVVPQEEGLVGGSRPLHEVARTLEQVVFDGFHPLARQGATVPDGLFSDAAEALVHGRIVLLRGLALQNAARSELLLKYRVVLRVVLLFRLFLGVEMIEVAVELVEAVGRRQELVAVTQMVLPD